MSAAAVTQMQNIQQWYQTTSSTTSSTTTIPTIVSSSGYTVVGTSAWGTDSAVLVEASQVLMRGRTYDMPDGSKVAIDQDGGFQIDDKDAKVLYRASHMRDFNPFMNASDLLEAYITELVPLGVRQDQVLHLEIERFIFWLIHKAAEHDHDPTPTSIPKLPPRTVLIRNRCAACGRFILRAFVDSSIFFCTPEHLLKQLNRKNLRGLNESHESVGRLHQTRENCALGKRRAGAASLDAPPAALSF